MEHFTDFFTNRKIKLKFPINVNDSYKDIKEKIFVSYDLKNTLVSNNTIAISNGKKYITNDSMTPEIFQNGNLVVYTLTEELIKYIIQDINRYLNITIHSPFISEIFNAYKSIYTTVTKNDIYFTILFILNNVLAMNLRKEQLEQLYIKDIYKKQEELILKFTTINQTVSFNQSDYITLHKGNPLYSIINSVVYYPIISKDKFDSAKLIREYPLDTTVPIMLTIEKKEPILKIHKSLSKTNVSDWYLKGNKELKKINGISFKLKIAENNYANALILDSNRISIRMSWNAKENVDFDTLLNSSSGINKVIKNISKIFPNKQIKLGNPYYGFLNFQFFTKKRIPFSKINVTIKKNFSNVFTLDEAERKKDFLKFIYIPLKTVILIRYTTDTNGNEINLVDALGVKNKNQILSIIDILVKLFATADAKQNVMEFKNFQFVSSNNQNLKPSKKINKNIQKLKDLGFTLDTISCQRERQPRKVNSINSQSLLNKKSLRDSLENAFTINYLGSTYECPNPEYPYPGFTNKNVLCCFKKDQRKKEVYKRNIGAEIITNVISDADILKKRIISTDKVLQTNRLGLLPSLLYNVFDKDYLRLGVTNGLLGAINRATGKNKDSQKDSITDLESLFNVNIIIFNVNEERILCKELYYFKHNETVFVLKNFDNYELIVKKNNDTLSKIFKTSSDITSKILDLYKKSCIVNYIGYPETPLTFADLPFTIQAQITNKFNKVIYILTKEAGLLPVVPTKCISGVKITTISQAKMNAAKQLELIKNVSIKYIQVSGQITNDNFTVGLVTKSGLIIPTKKSKKIPGLPVVYRQFIDNIDDLIYDDAENTDQRYTYMTTVKYYQELYNRLKYTLSKKINTLEQHIKKTENLVDVIHSVLKNEVTFIEKTKVHVVTDNRNVCSDLNDSINAARLLNKESHRDSCNDQFCKKIKGNCLLAIESKIYKAFLQRLATEILWNKDILSGNIISEFYGENKFIKRKNEIILLGQDSVKKFFNKN